MSGQTKTGVPLYLVTDSHVTLRMEESMTSLSFKEIRALDQVTAPLCISFYLPSEPGPTHQKANHIRLKNCIKALKKHIASSNYSHNQKADIIRRLERLRDSAVPMNGQSLSAFIGDKFTRIYSLNEPVETEMYVGTSFHTQPLRRILNR